MGYDCFSSFGEWASTFHGSPICIFSRSLWKAKQCCQLGSCLTLVTTGAWKELEVGLHIYLFLVIGPTILPWSTWLLLHTLQKCLPGSQGLPQGESSHQQMGSNWPDVRGQGVSLHVLSCSRRSQAQPSMWEWTKQQHLWIMLPSLHAVALVEEALLSKVGID